MRDQKPVPQICRHVLTALLILFTLSTVFIALNIEAAGIDSTSALTSNTVKTETATHFTVSAPAYVTAGSSFTITVTAKDKNGQTLTDYTGTVHFTSTDTASGVILAADYTFTALDQGVHVFTDNFALNTAGSRTITASDQATGSITGTSGVITVSAAEAATLVLTTPTSTTAGASFSVTVTLKDAYGNTATGYSGTVAFTSTDNHPSVVLPVDYQFRGADYGTHTFPYVILANAMLSPYPTITVTDKSDSSLSSTSCSIFVDTNYLNNLKFVGLPNSVVAGQLAAVKVQLQDAYGNRFLAESTQTIYLSASSGRWYSDITHQHQIGYVTVEYMQSVTKDIYYLSTEVGIDTLSASANKVNSATTSISVLPGPLDHFTITGYPAYVIGGKPFPSNITVTAHDVYNNIKTDYTGEAYFISSDLSAKLPYTPNHRYTFVAADKGVHSFSDFTLATEGSQTISVVDRATYRFTQSSPIIVSKFAYYTVTVTQNKYGAISPETSTVKEGSSLNYTITPYIYYHITSITVDSRAVAVTQPHGQTVTFLNIKADHNITASFAIDVCTITVYSFHNDPSVPTRIFLNAGSNYTVSVSSPDIISSTDRWICIGYSLDGGALISGTTYKFNRINVDHTITFSWVEQVTNMPLPALNSDHKATTLHISGNVNANQFSNVTITPHANTATVTVAFNLSGSSGTDGFVNMTVPKSSVAFGQVPSVYVDNQPAQNQSYIEDDANYYVWFSVHFSSHLIRIEFESKVIPTPTPTPTPTPIVDPTITPTPPPTSSPTEEPTSTPTPTPDPTDTPAPTPTATPSAPTVAPTDKPTSTPTSNNPTPIPEDSNQTIDSTTKAIYALVIFLVAAVVIVLILKR
jgi:hypothetical protein